MTQIKSQEKRALITGISGQDGYYLTQLLLQKGYHVHGLVRHTSTPTTWRLDKLRGEVDTKNLHLHTGDMTDTGSLARVISDIMPHEIYNLAAMSSAVASFNAAEATADINGVGVIRLLDVLRTLRHEDCKLFQASTAEMFGHPADMPQTIDTPFSPCTPYGCAKLYAHWAVIHHRETYGRFAVNGVLYNHESPLRGLEFVTRKIARGAAQVALGQQDKILLGNLDGQRDWGHAQDTVRAMWTMLQADTPKDYIVATGKMRTVREFATHAFAAVGHDIDWSGQGMGETGRSQKTGKVVVAVNPEFYRPAEAVGLCGDANPIQKDLRWQPDISFKDLVAEMTRAEVKSLADGTGQSLATA